MATLTIQYNTIKKNTFPFNNKNNKRHTKHNSSNKKKNRKTVAVYEVDKQTNTHNHTLHKQKQ